MATVLVMNASGKQTPKINKNTDILGIRKAARREIILQTRASVVLVQQSELNIDSFLPRTGRYPKYGCLGGKQAAILFRTECFELSGSASLRREVSALCDELEKTKILRTEHEVMSRLCLGQLQMTSNELKFLFISWSGPAYSDVERRKQVLRDMLTLIEMFMVGKPVLILIGGEFHLRFDEMVHIVGEYQHLHLCDCSKESSYPNKTSHFIISQQMAVMIGDIHVFDMNPMLRFKYKVHQPDFKQVLEHDPIYLNVHV